MSKETRHEAWESVFEPVRQPEWWQGDAKYHAPAYTEPQSELERRLKAGRVCGDGRGRAAADHGDEEVVHQRQFDQALRGVHQLHR